MAFRFDREALVHRVDKLEDEVRDRDAELSRLRRDLAVPRAEQRWRRAIIALGVIALLLTIVVLRITLRPMAEALAGPAEVQRWRADDGPEGPLFVDVDGDGAEELVGIYESHDGVYLGVLDGRSFTAKWRLALAAEGGPRHLAVSQGRLFVTEGAALEIRALADGKSLARVALEQPALELCARAERRGPVWVRGRSVHHEVDASGALRASLRPSWCNPHQITSPPRIGGNTTETAFIDGRHVVALGHDGEVPTLFGFRVGDGQVRWQQSLVRGTEALTPGREAVVQGGQLVVAQQRGEAVRVEALDVATGSRRWQLTLDGVAASASLHALVAGRERLAVSYDGRVTVLAAGTGEILTTLGN